MSTQALPVRSPVISFIKAIIDRISSALDGVPVYNEVPEQHSFPYASIGDDTGDAPWNMAKTVVGREVAVAINFWSQYHGTLEVLKLMGNAATALTKQDLVLEDDFKLVLMAVESMTTVRLADGKTRQGVLRLRARIQDKNLV